MFKDKSTNCRLISTFLAAALNFGAFFSLALLSKPAQAQFLGLMQLEAMENYSEYTSLPLVGGRGSFQIASFSNYLNVSNEFREKIHRELEPGEVVKWGTQPVPRFFTTYSTSTFLFGIFWTTFSLCWIGGAWGITRSDRSFFNSIGDRLFPLFGIPFVLTGFWMLSSPLLVWNQAHQTAYLITDKRAISIEGGIMTKTIQSWLPEQLGDIYRRENNDGTGDLIIKVIIERRLSRDSEGYQREEKYREEVGFKGIRNPQEVEKMLKELAKTAT